MDFQKRLAGFIKLGEKISSFLAERKKDDKLNSAIKNSFVQNGWFTDENVCQALSAISMMLEEKNILKFISTYDFSSLQGKKSVGVIMPSNIPLAGFHDFFCVLLTGNFFLGKCSSQDNILLPALAAMLVEIEPEFQDSFHFVNNFSGAGLKVPKPDHFIATGSNNSSRYFEYYFGKYPHIIRKNRNSLAVLTGSEKAEDLRLLSNDIFLYFGLGCRNVSKLMLPEGYDFKDFFKGIFHRQDIIYHNKYANNYTYNKAINLMNKIKLWDNGFLLLKEDQSLSSPVAMLHYEFYSDENNLSAKLAEQKNEIQCLVAGNGPLALPLEKVSFGQAQMPRLWDFPDGVDTMKFLLNPSPVGYVTLN